MAPTNDHMRYIDLQNELSGRLALDSAQRVLVWLSSETGSSRVHGTVLFTENEWAVLLPVLEQYPNYCPFEIVVASFGGTVTEQTIVRARNAMNRAIACGELNSILKPVRNMMSRVRLKLRPIGLDVLSIYQTGYILMPRKNNTEAREGNSL